MRTIFPLCILILYQKVEPGKRNDFPDRVYERPCCKFIESTNMYEYKMPYVNLHSLVSFNYNPTQIRTLRDRKSYQERLRLRNEKPIYYRIGGKSYFWFQKGSYVYLNKELAYWLRGSLHLGYNEDRWNYGWMIGRYQCFRSRMVIFGLSSGFAKEGPWLRFMNI